TDVPDVKKEDLLTILFDVLCAYQLTLPLSFTQTTYDFSRLPHLICNTESPLITDAIEERAVTFLLAFPEGKLRGFREVRGEDTSTVLLLLKHLTRSSSKSDVHALKTKLLNKFIKETGLFAHTEWEIAVWLDTLTTFNQDESQQIVDVFYKSLTQAIRNPYPFNDKVIEAMKSSHASYQSGQGECMNNDDASMTDILTLIKHTTSCDLNGSDLITTLENQPMTEVLHTEPMPCSALMPSALQIFCQLENNTQSLFGQYVSLVALSILERQDNPISVCLLLHHCVLVEGSDLQHNLYWQDFMKYYGLWLPHVFEKNSLYKRIKSSSMDRIAIKTKKDWRSVLRSSIMQNVELSVSDMELLLQCDQTELLSMTRLLLMYINTLHILKPKNFLAVLCSYLKMIENSLEHIEPKKDKENKHNTEEARNMTKDDTPSDIDSRHEASDEWWTDMAGLVLQHAVFRETFSHSARNFQYEKDRLQILDVITSFFLKCLRLFELHLPNDKLTSLLQPIFKESCQNYLNFVNLEMNAKKANTRQVKHEFRRVMELFEAICVYSKDLELIEATTILLQSLNSLEISDAYPGSKQYFRSSLCRLLEILAERQRALKLKHSTNAVIRSEADVLSFSDISTLVELAHKFDCDQMVSVLSQFVESNHKLVSVFTKSSYIDWLNKPSQTISQLLCQLVKFGSAEQLHWFEVWCEESSTQELSNKKDILLPVVSTYCNHSSASNYFVFIL
ncbi:nucleolar pre-ribosomal-associated protein 1-like, partial [Acanthaster planci]|uniref:Nucleolar pre-ribosomal-associated protein 1-like n=1 Tax=Acanthaster planci TaxID=133434 RepID=A0A8B8A5X4_ACAPL